MPNAPSSAPVEEDPPMGRTYGKVILCEIAVVTFLWWFGRAFSS
jgi:hypothetical protein